MEPTQQQQETALKHAQAWIDKHSGTTDYPHRTWALARCYLWAVGKLNSLGADERTSLMNRISYLQIENDHLKSEAAVCRERLGPAGYRILQEVTVLRKVASYTAYARTSLGWDRHRKDINSRAVNKILDALDEYDRYMVQHK